MEEVETPTRKDLAKLDRKRPKKKTSNKDWVHPHDPEARIAKMKDCSTHMAHKFEQAVVETRGGVRGDGTVDGRRRHGLAPGDAGRGGAAVGGGGGGTGGSGGGQGIPLKQDDDGGEGPGIAELRERARPGTAQLEAEPRRPQADLRQPSADPEGQRKRLLRQRGEKLERGFAHMLETGGLRRVHVRGREEIRRRILIQAAAFNLGLLTRSLYGIGTPRGFQGLAGVPAALARHLGSAIGHLIGLVRRRLGPLNAFLGSATPMNPGTHLPSLALQLPLCSTVCKAFTRAYAFLSYNNLGWEERSIFLNFLTPKLPAPEEPDLSKGILERIDMDSCRVEKHKMRRIILHDGRGRRQGRDRYRPAVGDHRRVQRPVRRNRVGGPTGRTPASSPTRRSRARCWE